MTLGAVPRGFSWSGYRALIQAFLDRGYAVKLFGDLDPTKSHLVLRHDIDFSLRAAVDIARIEADMGVRANYYVLLQTEFYNLCSPEDWARVVEIAELGHDVGLHFDASRYDADLEMLEAAVARECSVLAAIMGREVTTVSFHRPAQSLLGLARPLAGRLHAYQPRFFSEIAYVADSRGLFRYGHPLDHEAFAAAKAMQLLTHPIWWPQAEAEDKMSLLDDLLQQRQDLLLSEAIANCKPYAEYRGRRASVNHG
ncbi:hypothetical protein [Rhodovulum sulfidophilum]|uniref:hypothetical protein n=1 Tax=Rhodovulum sulfidophilum TaxID=35806 RepID=UPI00138971EF|nr:hypothetical protein [Rhodovulum sulfidophilum]NDK36739.1 hypothetical protein [Rhodovulum sulfidophilum]